MLQFLIAYSILQLTVSRGKFWPLSRPALSSLQVSWVRRRGEELHLLTIGLDTYASDSRFSLAFEKPNDWRLLLRSATERDAGLYECQVSAHPPLIRTVHLAVSGKWTRHCVYVHLTIRDLATSKAIKGRYFLLLLTICTLIRQLHCDP